MTQADPAGYPWLGRELSPSPFAHDDGGADPVLAAALEAHRRGDAGLSAVVEALRGARVLVPVLAHGTGRIEGPHGLPTDREAGAGVVALAAPDGRSVLSIFSSVAAMTGWQPDARPVPARAESAARSAVDEGWELMVLDPHGTDGVLLPRPAVWALADGIEWRPAVGAGGVDAAVEDAIRTALAGLEPPSRVGVEAGQRAEVAVVLHLPAGLGQAAVDALTAAVNTRLAASEVVSTRVDSIELVLRADGAAGT